MEATQQSQEEIPPSHSKKHKKKLTLSKKRLSKKHKWRLRSGRMDLLHVYFDQYTKNITDKMQVQLIRLKGTRVLLKEPITFTT